MTPPTDESIPLSATYRLQLQPRFGLDAAAAIADYLASLGITHAYCSPYLQAASGSTHGYDIVDHGRVNDELGGEPAFWRFVEALRAHGLTQVVDVVPNHMAVSTGNRWWADVLENGPSSHFASYFDVDWDPPEARLRNLVLLPVLADHYGRVLENGEIRLERDGASFFVIYGSDHRYPLSASSLGPLLGPAARQAGSDVLADLADAFSALPRPTATDRASVRRRHRDKEVLHAALDRLLRDEAAVAAAVDEVVRATNGDPDALHTILELQNYRLAWWRSAGRDLGYRRFFDVNTLIGLRTEDEQVFEDIHRRVLDWARGGLVAGLRVDHPDGLRDPQEYFERLRAAVPNAWIIAEKILSRGETLPAEWPVAGTTGYDFLNLVTRLFVDPSAEAPLTQFYAEFTGESTDYGRIAHDKMLLVARDVLGSDVNRLTGLLVDICERHRRYRDYSRHHLTDAIREVIAWHPVYRTYVRPAASWVRESDRRVIEAVTRAAAAERPDLEPALFEFLRALLALEITGPLEAEFVSRLQQTTGPAMAKGIEDTTFYVYNRFIALNEVGGDPTQFAVSVDAFHAACRDAQASRPRSMLATSTHDTKRSEDVRARLALLSECPVRWSEAVRRWSSMANRYRTGQRPDRNTEYYLYQTLVGAWPLSLERAVTHMEKAAREARLYTSWTSPDAPYEAALRRFVEGVWQDADLMEDVRAFVAPLVRPGWINSLSQTLLKLTCPGVPDVYQGCELWAHTLVDPDNRGLVDFDLRRQRLAELDGLTPDAIWRRAEDGLPKPWIIREALRLRRERPQTFGPSSEYLPLAATGPHAHRVLAFRRGTDVVVAVPRLVLGDPIGEGARLALPPGEWRNRFDADAPIADEVDCARLWRTFPVALLVRCVAREL
ncbi:MAG: malto-oligosyltrehalose synthase [Acidobacteria bacterium]|nr:malto-oligosyltrehalose synthase [Acidobacteriota bacterium]